jgi:hypothetical protein
VVRNISKVLIPLKRVLKREQDFLPFTGVGISCLSRMIIYTYSLEEFYSWVILTPKLRK